MHIALIVPGGVDKSGEYRVIPALLSLIRRLARDHDVHVFALNQQTEAASWPLCGATVHNVGTRRPLLSAVAAILRQHRHRPFDVVHAIWSGRGGMAAVAAALLLGRPSLIHIAGGELVSLPDIHYGGMQSWKGRLRERLVLRVASRVTAASAPTLNKLAGFGVCGRRVPLGVDRERWPPRAPLPRVAGGTARLVHVASLNWVKDQTTLLRALALLRERGVDFQMEIIGEDTLHGAMQRTARQLDLEGCVHFAGFLTQSELRPRVACADLLVHSSRHETGPLVMLEAAALGVPTVGTAVGHIAEWSPEAALAVPVGDWRALAEAVAELLGDEKRRLALGVQAQCRALREDADHTAACFQSLYAEVA